MIPSPTAQTSQPVTTPSRLTSDVSGRLAALGLVAITLTLVLVGALHLLPETSGISPVRRTISEYALSPLGWMFEVAVLLLAVGSVAILLSLIGRGLVAAKSTGAALIGIWAVSLVMLVIFTKHNWAVGPSVQGHIHRVFSLTAFISLPFGVLAIAGKWRRSATDRAAAWWATGLGWLSLIAFSPLALAVILAPVTGTPWYRAIPLGLVERGLAFSEVVAVIALGIWAASRKRTAS